MSLDFQNRILNQIRFNVTQWVGVILGQEEKSVYSKTL